MRILLAVLSTTFLAAGALAQQQPAVTPPVVPEGTAQAKAAIAECDRLINFLETARPPGAGVTVQEVTAWRQASDFERCHATLQRFTEARPGSSSTPPNQAGTPGGSAGPTGLPTVTRNGPPASSPAAPGPAPQASPPQAQAQPGAGQAGAASAPQIVVQQAPPNVTVRQRQPEIIVRQAPPIITVQQPHPEIIVRMPEPDVNVAVVRPEVQVNIPQPVIQVVPPQAQAQPEIRTEGQQPIVRFERTGEPRIVYQPAEGQPQVRFESMAEGSAQGAAPQEPRAPAGGLTQQAAQAQLNGGRAGPAAASRPAPPSEPAQTGALPEAAEQAVRVSQLEDMAVFNGRGERLGTVEEVLMGADRKAYLVIEHGGFLGLGEKRVALAADQLTLQGDRLVAENLTGEQLQSFPEFKRTDNFREMDREATASIRGSR